MRLIQTGQKFLVYDEGVRTYERLPSATFQIGYNQQEGCFLILTHNLQVEEKAYGSHDDKLEKVISSFRVFQRSLGVILSGDKGIGKSMFAKMLCSRAVAEGYPVIIVDACYPGIARFLQRIEQECVVLFDEFDKMFRYDDEDKDDQSSLLSMFDGTAGGKKLYVITCNQLYYVTSYIVNRPGRFHYHFRFAYPAEDDIRAYLSDKLNESASAEIERVVDFARRVDLNYDCLRAIAFELNRGSSFKEAIADLNILVNEDMTFDVYLYLDGGIYFYKLEYRINLYERDGKMGRIDLNDDNGTVVVTVYFNKTMVRYDPVRGGTVIPAEGLKLKFTPEAFREYQNAKPLYMSFAKREKTSLNYVL